jgi:hypothetical protein
VSTSVLREVTAAADPALREYAVGEPRDAGYGDFVLEAIREGYELHYGTPRAFAGCDDDLRLLAGDALYAMGLSRLAETGDLDAVAELADLISTCARAQAENRPEQAEQRWAQAAKKLAQRA